MMIRLQPTAMCLMTALGVCSLSGCISSGNDRTVIGDEQGADAVRLDALHGSAPLAPATGPSLTDVYRADWNDVTFHVPVDGTRHHPHLTSLYPGSGGTLARRSGMHPTADSATLDDSAAPFTDVFVAPVAAGVDIILMVPRAVAPSLRPSPQSYDRYQEGGLPTPLFQDAPGTGT